MRFYRAVYSRGLKLAVSLALTLVAAAPMKPLQADVLRSAELYGHDGATVQLRVDSQLAQLFSRISFWEQELESQGIKAQFRVGTELLRNALLGIEPLPGHPREVDLFIQLIDIDLRPATPDYALTLLNGAGLKVGREMRAIFGPGAKIRFWVKDRRMVRSRGFTYLGAEGILDTSQADLLGKVFYSPTRHRIYGEGEELAPLVRRRVTLPRQNPFAGLRLRLETMLYSNPNELKAEAAAPVERDVPARARLDRATLESLLPVFRNRANSELAAIRDILTDELPQAYKQLKEAGLDVDLLCQPRSTGTELERDAIELQAMLSKGWRTMKSNPFQTDATVRALAGKVRLPGLRLDGARRIPEKVLMQADSRLYLNTLRFETLPSTEQRWTVAKYLALAKHLHASMPVCEDLFMPRTWVEVRGKAP